MLDLAFDLAFERAEERIDDLEFFLALESFFFSLFHHPLLLWIYFFNIYYKLSNNHSNNIH